MGEFKNGRKNICYRHFNFFGATFIIHDYHKKFRKDSKTNE